MDTQKTIVISLGGSLIVPQEVDTQFLRQFKNFIESYIQKDYKFVLICGGGKLAREYRNVAVEISKLASEDIKNNKIIKERITDEDKDWLGIHATRLNAHLVRTIFKEYAHPKINTNPEKVEEWKGCQEPLIIAAGWRPGHSTDFIAVSLAKNLGIKKVINLSNISYIYDKDPNQFPEAKKIEEISWEDFQKIVGDEWNPGANFPFDPIASKLASKEEMEVAVMNGQNLDNLGKYLEGGKFEGSLIR